MLILSVNPNPSSLEEKLKLLPPIVPSKLKLPSIKTSTSGRPPFWRSVPLKVKKAAAVTAASAAACWALSGMFSLVLGPGTSPFTGLMPASTTWAAEGTPAETAAFLKDHCGLAADFMKSPAMKKSKNARVLAAVVPQGGAGTSAECQSYLTELAGSVEELWNKDSVYPQTLPIVPPCPAHGQVTYQSNGDSFTLTCHGPSHTTVYSSENGLSIPGQPADASNLADAPSCLDEDGERNPDRIASRHLSELADSPDTQAAIRSTDLSPLVRKPAAMTEADPNFSYYNSPITAAGAFAEKLDKIDQPQAAASLPAPFAVGEPLLIAVANVKDNIPGCFRLKEFPGLQLWSSDPELCQKILGSRNRKSQGMEFQPAGETDFQLNCQGDVCTQIFPGFAFNLPQGATVQFHKADAKDGEYSGRIIVPASAARVRGQIPEDFDASDMLGEIKPCKSMISYSSALTGLLSGQANVLNASAASVPEQAVIGFDGSASSINQLSTSVAQAMSGRAGFRAEMTFKSENALSKWLQSGNWKSAAYSTSSSSYCKTEADKNVLRLSAGEAAEAKTVKIPDGPAKAQLCGRVFLTGKGNEETACTFACGLLPSSKDSQNTVPLWFSVKTEKQIVKQN